MSDDPDPRADLRRRHEALREELARLERELADGAKKTMPPEAKASTSPADRDGFFAPSAAGDDQHDPDALLRHYARDEPRLDPRAARRGCLLAFAGALVVLLTGVAAVYFLFYTRR